MSGSRSRVVWRCVRCILLAAVAAAMLVPALAALLDYQERESHLAELREMESHSIGPENPPAPASFFPVEVVPRPPLVTGFQTVSAGDASDDVHDHEFVLGVVVDGAARAWPLNVMTGPEREVFNDSLGGRSIAATW